MQVANIKEKNALYFNSFISNYFKIYRNVITNPSLWFNQLALTKSIKFYVEFFKIYKNAIANQCSWFDHFGCSQKDNKFLVTWIFNKTWRIGLKSINHWKLIPFKMESGTPYFLFYPSFIHEGLFLFQNTI